MTPPGHRWISAWAIAAQLAAPAGAAASAGAPPPASESRASVSAGLAASAFEASSGSAFGHAFQLDPARRRPGPRPAIALQPVPFPSPAPDPLFGSTSILAFGAEDPAAPAGADAEDAAPEALAPHTAGLTERKRSTGRSWWVWTGSAALVGLFVAGFAHDLRNETGPPPEEPELPYFPDTP
jgi:hypothetical protein